ncbi:SulP family inorganic anion transporter, partial [Pseudoalteromonas sp. SIMBA_148]
PIAPTLITPWQLPGADGQPLTLDFELIRALMGPAIAIAMLGAIESLLCSVVAGGVTRRRQDADGEGIGEGLGSLIVTLFAG